MELAGLPGPPEVSRVARKFVELCDIESPTGRESGAARYVRADLEAFGLTVEEDDTGPETGADCGNLFTRIAGPEGARTVMLCAHLDTVPLADQVEVEMVGGVHRHRRGAVRGAEHKAVAD